jgi:hypothetical protein
MSLIKDQLGSDNVLQKLGQSFGVDSGKVSKLTQLGLPAMLEGMTRNAQTREGAESLAQALDQHQDDSVDDIEDYFNKVDAQDGAKILNPVFAGKNKTVQKNLAKKTGLNGSQVLELLSTLAPLVLGALGNQKKSQNLDASGIAVLLPSLGGLLGGGDLSDITRILDTSKGGDILGSIKNLLGKFQKK